MRGGSGTPSSVPILAMSATYPSRPSLSSGRAPKVAWARRKLSASAMCTQVSKCGSEAAYGRPSGAVPVTRWWIALTRAMARSASSVRPNVVMPTKWLVRCSRPHGSPR